jgi:hypothetical protein
MAKAIPGLFWRRLLWRNLTREVMLMIWRFLFTAELTLTLVRAETNAELEIQVRNTELAFAKTMADRDHKAFTRFLASDAVFTNGPKALRGSRAVAAASCWTLMANGLGRST